jgi:hypothetical protein
MGCQLSSSLLTVNQVGWMIAVSQKGAILKTRQNMQGLVNVPFFLGMLNILNITKTRYLVEKIYPQCLGDVKN